MGNGRKWGQNQGFGCGFLMTKPKNEIQDLELQSFLAVGVFSWIGISIGEGICECRK
jgi:hypothetical protein